jgi:hypothetical protein
MGRSGVIDKHSEEWRLGEWGRDRVAELLKELGWKVTALDRIDNGGAPAMEGPAGFFAALPDFDTTKLGERRYVEVKTKTAPAFFVKWQREVHGISLRSLDSYKAVQQESGTPCWLVVVERERWNILSAPLSYLIQPMWSRMYQGQNEQDNGGNIYFDRQAFNLLGTIPGPGEIFELRDRRWLPSRFLR